MKQLADFPDKHTAKEGMMATHLFHFAAENSICDWYHTEKLFGALKSGTLPIYFGSRSITPFLPHKAVLVAYEYKNIFVLAAHLKELAANQTAYEEYMVWRKRPLPETVIDHLCVAQAERSPAWACEICKLIATTPPGNYEKYDSSEECEQFPMSEFLKEDGDVPKYVRENMKKDFLRSFNGQTNWLDPDTNY